MNRNRTAVILDPGNWNAPVEGLADDSFSAYRIVGKIRGEFPDFPTDRTRLLPTDHAGNALRSLLIENQSRGEDIWVFHNESLWPEGAIGLSPFRPSLVSVIGVREVFEEIPLLAPYQPRDLTILPWETLRFIDFAKIEWNPREDFLLTYSNHANRRGFSPYLVPQANPQSDCQDIGESIVRSHLLDQEKRPFHRHRILTSLKKMPIRKREGLSLLVDLTHIRNGYNGTMEYGRNLFKGILEVHSETSFSTIKAIGEPRYVEFHGISREHLIDQKDTTFFDLCFRPYQIDNPKVFADVVFRGRRFVISQLDAIGSRCDYIYDSTMRFYQRMGIAASDGVVCISEYGLRDAIEFFDLDPAETPCRAFLLGMEPTGTAPVPSDPNRKKSFVVVGSWRYDHKMLRPALDAVRACFGPSDPGILFHFLGDLSGERDLPDSVRYHKHDQTQEELDQLFASVDGFIFPSVYEGYGLPIMHAFRFKKPVLVADTEVNREIQASFQGSEVHYFNSEKELPMALKAFVEGPLGPNIPKNPRSWAQVAQETLHFLAECARSEPVENSRKQNAREALFLASCQVAETTLPHARTQNSKNTLADSVEGASEIQPPMHVTTPEKSSKSVLPKPLEDAWVQNRDHLPAPLVRFLRAIRKRIPDGPRMV